MRAVLVREGGEQANAQIPLEGGELLKIGRVRTDITLPHSSVSRDHATLQHGPEGWVLSDEASRNGTRVNGVAIVRRLLRDGDRILFGELSFIFRELDEDAPVAPKAGKNLPISDEDEWGADDGRTRTLTHLPTSLLGRGIDSYLMTALKHFATASASGGELQGALRLIVEDIHGIRGMRRVLLHLPAAVIGKKAVWINAGATHAQPGVVFPEERMLACAQAGRAVVITAGRERDIGSGVSCDAVCIAIRTGSAPGFLYAEGEQDLDARSPEMVRAAAEGLELGLAIWQKAAQRPPAPPELAAKGAASPLLVGRSLALQKAVRMAIRAAATDSTVLLRGESGTGKELFARLIYTESNRRDGPFVPVHCSAIEETLMGSALFGHEKGAFTGAIGLKKGLFETADHGTIFLDEIGELSHDAQVKLLRILQEGEFMRVGGTQPIHVDVRVIAATNRNLEQAMRDGRFREDLYYRLKVIQLDLPPLRDRREDIPELVKHFIEAIGATMPCRAAGITDAAMQALQAYNWPGNVRELRNIVERALVLVEGDKIDVDDLPMEWQAASETAPATSLDSMERSHITKILAECNGNKSLAAQRLGISRSSLYEKLKLG